MGTATRPRARPKPPPGPPRRRPRGGDGFRVDPARRLVIGRMIMVALLVICGLKLVTVQTFQAPQLRADGDKQRVTRLALPAERGAILDRNGTPMAFSVQAKALTANPEQISRDQGPNATARKTDMALTIARLTGADANQLYAALNTPRPYVILVPSVEPAAARAVAEKFPEITQEARESRQYPGGELAANVLGAASWNMDKKKLRGVVGLEASQDNLLAGTDGFRMVDTAEGSNTVIPGSERAEKPAVGGSNLQLTLDADLQYSVQQQLAAYVAAHGAKNGSAVVLDAATGEVRALANSATFDPRNLSAPGAQLGNAAVTTPFEPGSVNKIVTMAAALESGMDNPMTVKDVPDSIKIADRTIHDAWVHPTQKFTLTGILARSSNVGTLMTAQQIGPDRFWDMLQRMGIGQRTEVGLPGESPGRVPPRASWSGSTFGNLPIGQGLSMTVLQLAGMYQAVANDGLRVPPRILAATVGPDGARHAEPAPAPVRVVSPQVAEQLRHMLTAVTQDGKGVQRGTGVKAAVEGYQVAGKTGTAQQVNPACGCYSSNTYWITFAGMFPADHPRYVAAIMLDAPTHGQDASELFHQIASGLAQRDRIPVSTEPTPMVPLVVP
ncbi:peptidoglycan D,D-transpeptidase FtsI family protein [Pseudonocardia spinosispora]|uniref:peptidoglycan D,D-transpeptidase FtsI family protein n=1 Tax=Pseudonocardia spinosispora TaxID=103441 RepID=UPI000A05D543|nr:penicillin-binding protein 2 [Pseudonocardia spinosispora]